MGRIARASQRWGLGLLFLLCAAACLATAWEGLERPPHSLANRSVASVLVALSLGCLYLAAAVVSWRSNPPFSISVQDPAIGLALVVLSALAITGETPTSFVSWEQWRGAPLTWLMTGHYFGPCGGEAGLCSTDWLITVRPLPLAGNLAAAAVAACLVRRPLRGRRRTNVDRP